MYTACIEHKNVSEYARELKGKWFEKISLRHFIFIIIFLEMMKNFSQQRKKVTKEEEELNIKASHHLC